MSSTAAPTPVTRAINKTGWYGGFKVVAGDATLTPAGRGANLKVTLTYTNLFDVSATPARPALTANGTVLSATSDQPEIPGQGTASTDVQAYVANPSTTNPPAALDLNTAMDSVVVTYGEVADNQTLIPLSASGQVTSVEPQAFDTKIHLVAGHIVLDLTKFYLAPSYKAGEKGKVVVTMHLRVACSAGCSPSGYSVGRADFSIKGPDGTSIVADQRSGYCCTADYPGTNDDNTNNSLAFVLPAPGTGAYTVTFQPEVSGLSKVSKTFTF